MSTAPDLTADCLSSSRPRRAGGKSRQLELLNLTLSQLSLNRAPLAPDLSLYVIESESIPFDPMSDSEENPSQSGKPAPCRQYHVCKTSFQRHYTITTPDDQPLYYGEISSFTHKPDLILRSGSSKDDPAVAMCKFPKFSSVLKVGLGDPDINPHSQWEDMTKETVWGSEYRWSMNLHDWSDQVGERKGFVWKRTQHVTAEGVSASKMSSRNYKLQDETGQLLAVFTSDRTYRKCGTLQVNVSYGEDFDTMVFITCLGLYEKARRRKNKSAGGGGGGAP